MSETTFRRDIGEGEKPGRGAPSTARGARPRRNVEEGLDGAPARRRGEAAYRRPPLPSRAEREGRGGVVEAGVEAGEPLVPHQHEEALTWGDGAGLRGRSRSAVLDGVGAVVGEGLAGGDADASRGARSVRPFTG